MRRDYFRQRPGLFQHVGRKLSAQTKAFDDGGQLRRPTPRRAQALDHGPVSDPVVFREARDLSDYFFVFPRVAAFAAGNVDHERQMRVVRNHAPAAVETRFEYAGKLRARAPNDAHDPPSPIGSGRALPPRRQDLDHDDITVDRAAYVAPRNVYVLLAAVGRDHECELKSPAYAQRSPFHFDPPGRVQRGIRQAVAPIVHTDDRAGLFKFGEQFPHALELGRIVGAQGAADVLAPGGIMSPRGENLDNIAGVHSIFFSADKRPPAPRLRRAGR